MHRARLSLFALLVTEGLTLNHGLTLRFDAHQIRVVVRDTGTGIVGSVIVPVAQIAGMAGD